jgi:ribosomal protein L22
MEDKDAIIHQLRQENAELRKIIEELNRKIADLEEKLRLNSQNSSKPPSSDRYPKKQPPPKIRKSEKEGRDFLENGFQKKKSANSLNIILKIAMAVAEVISCQKQKLQKLAKL